MLDNLICLFANFFPALLIDILFLLIQFQIILYCRTIKGRIDQKNQVLTLTLVDSATNRYAAIDKWTNQLATLNLSISQKII